MHATLTDFGLSRVMSGTVIMSTRTMMAGTPGFQSREQLCAQNVGLPSDIYALGCLMTVLFSGQPLWPGLTPYQIMVKVTVENEKPSTHGVPAHIKATCAKCMLDDTDRPTAAAVLQLLLKI